MKVNKKKDPNYKILINDFGSLPFWLADQNDIVIAVFKTKKQAKAAMDASNKMLLEIREKYAKQRKEENENDRTTNDKRKYYNIN